MTCLWSALAVGKFECLMSLLQQMQLVQTRHNRIRENKAVGLATDWGYESTMRNCVQDACNQELFRDLQQCLRVSQL